ncbi:MAG UNVERIFIED_CONTAM: hypothetical protein LVR18_09730 [Planctomycetaceae bacterium]|jgi:hypothetical protein
MKVIRSDDPGRDFTTAHYREILQSIRASHRTLCFRDVHALGRSIFDIPKFVIMRHDVEFSIPAALRMAEIEADEGIQATYFLLQTSDYNPFEEEEAVQIRRILDLGHEIGLHYDAALFERLGVDPAATAVAQIQLFETFFRTKIHAMSSHMPMRSGKTFSVPGVIDTYDPMFLTEMKYISDSTQSWRKESSRKTFTNTTTSTCSHTNTSGTPAAGTGALCCSSKFRTNSPAHGNAQKTSSICTEKA